MLKARGGYISRKNFGEIVGRLCHLKKTFVAIFLKEMEQVKLIKIINKRTVFICNSNEDLENTSKMYREMKIF